MKNLFKLILISPIFLCLFLSCQQAFSHTEETITLELPDWPPETEDASLSQNYPELSRWKIQINTCSEIKTFWLTPQDKVISFTISKNQPASLTALPITFLADGNESAYFYPAGFVYPSSFDSKTNSRIRWEEGYLADLIHKIIAGKTETGVSTSRLQKFMFSFNWKKAQETIDSRIESSLSDSLTACYNPWQIDTANLLDNLCYGSFKVSLLNITSAFTYNLDTLFPLQDLTPLSAFIPENQKLSEKGLIVVKKACPTLIGDGKEKGLVFVCNSAKNLSREYIYMPIYCEDYEKIYPF